MGGQACVFYGAAEFSRDVDFAILASPANFRRLQLALDQDLNALGEHLEKERLAEVEADRGYWQPLRRALEQIEQKSVENGEGANSTQYGMSLRSFSSLRDSITLRYLLFE